MNTNFQVADHEDEDQDQNQNNQFQFELKEASEIDKDQDKYPYCIVWTVLPLISWFLPFIGHTGICMSDGTIHDFAGAYYISVDDFAFGKPLKYVKLDNSQISKEKWNKSVQSADSHFSKTMHNIFCNNCHSHVAGALNAMEYQGSKKWNMFDIWLMCLTKSKYVTTTSILKTYYGFFIILMIVILFMK